MKNKITKNIAKFIYIAIASFSIFWILGTMAYTISYGEKPYLDYMLGYMMYLSLALVYVGITITIIGFLHKAYTKLYNKLFPNS